MDITKKASIGDVVVAREKVWSKDHGSYLKKGHEVIINHLDDLIILPEPHKWEKKKKQS